MTAKRFTRYAHLIMSGALILLLSVACAANVSTWQEQYDLGLRYLSEGNYEEAIIAFTAAIEIDSKQALAYVGRGDAYILSGETEENLAAAQADYETAISLDKMNANAYLGLAEVYIRTGAFDKAEELLRLALEVIGDNQAISDKLAEFSSNNIFDSQGNSRKTIWRAPDGTIESYIIQYYDTENRSVKEEYYDANGILEDYGISIWGEDGYREDRYAPDGSLKFSNNHTDLHDNGEFYSRVDSYDENGTLYLYTLYGHGRTEHYSPDGRRLGYEVYEYNEAGQRTKWLRYNANDELWEYYVTEYDSEGNRTRYTNYDASGAELNHIDYSESD